MQVTVEYCAQIKQAIGVSSEVITLEEACSAQDLVAWLARERGEPLSRYLLDEDGKFRTNNLLVVGEEQVRWDTPVELRDGDVVTLLPPISGGAPTVSEFVP